MDASNGDLLPAANEAAIRALENGSLGLCFSGAGFLLFYVRVPSENRPKGGGGEVESARARERGGGGWWPLSPPPPPAGWRLVAPSHSKSNTHKN
jgi:hypothetical protein